MADRQTIPGSHAANPDFRGSICAEGGGQVFVYHGGLDLDETREFVVARGSNVVLEVIDASAIAARGRPTRRRRWPDTAPSTWNCAPRPRSVSPRCCLPSTRATASAERRVSRRINSLVAGSFVPFAPGSRAGTRRADPPSGQAATTWVRTRTLPDS